jgi:prolipoprotein diacylglyceryltransferase
VLYRAWRRRGRVPGEVVAAYLALYGAGRFLLEFTRGDAARGVWFGGRLSTSQLISLLVAPCAAAAFVLLRRRAARTSAEVLDGPAGAPVPEGGGELPVVPRSPGAGPA